MSEPTQTPANTGSSASSADTATIDRAVAEGGAYEVLHRRLTEQGGRLRALAERLNAERLAEFGSSELKLLGRLRVRSEHNAIARDIVRVGEWLLFGYNVFLGLKRETQIGDVFSLYRLVDTGDGFDVEPADPSGSFLAAPSFVNDFRELYAYYKHTRLLQLVVRDGKLLAAFQIGERLGDIRVFRWSLSPDGRDVRYIDNRGERDLDPPPPYDFEWIRTTRDDAVDGRHPHVNILDTVFVETINGDLTVKVENNTEDGLGIYREPVSDQTQSLDDARIEYARLGSLILLRVLPYREEQWRHLVFNTLTRQVQRIDAIGQACVQLPEDHGIVYPGGYTLQNGESKAFERTMPGMGFRRMIRSPNGEDVLYVFYEPEAGHYALFTYNMIERRLQPPIFAHGYARFDDGRIVMFSADGGEPTRVHPMQVWRTPFASDEHAAAQPTGSGFHARVGNAELVRGISDLLHLTREIGAPAVSSTRFEQLVAGSRRLFDLHHWLAESPCADIAGLLHEVAATAEAVLDEFEKVESIRSRSARALREAQTRQRELLARLDPGRWERIQDHVDGLNSAAAQRGHLLTLRDYRYIDRAALDVLEAELLGAHERAAEATAAFLASERALQPFAERLVEIEKPLAEGAALASTSVLQPIIDTLATMAADLDMLSTLMASLPVDDAERRTRIVEAISSIYARLNQARARAEQRRRELGSAEAMAQFGAQFALFGQSVTGALASSTDPEACDEQLARVLIQLEELESRFGEHEPFLNDILARREEVVEAFEARKQALLDDRQRKARAVADAAQRILDGLARRTATLADLDALNAFFAGDPLIVKLRELAARLRQLHDSVKADDVEAKLKAVRDQAVRGLRDRAELFEGGGELIRLGRHRFSVNRQELDLTLIPHGDALCLHLTGTDYLEPIDDDGLAALRDYWQVALESESPSLYRGEYLAAELLEAARRGEDGLTPERLRLEAVTPATLERTVRAFAAPRYRDGYEKGIHDHDAARILAGWLPLREAAGLLAFEPESRALAWLAWTALAEVDGHDWPLRARIAQQLATLLGDDRARAALAGEIAAAIARWRERSALVIDGADPQRAADYLVRELAEEHPRFIVSRHAQRLLAALEARLRDAHGWDRLHDALRTLTGAAAWALALGALLPLCRDALADERDHACEAAALLLVGHLLPHRISQADLRIEIDGLLGQHPAIEQGRLLLAVDRFEARLQQHRVGFVAGVRQFQALRQRVLQRERAAMRLDEFRSRPLASFVRNRLIDQVYLPIIGDNLAKQIGTAGEGKRSDLMGLLLLISPPGYGKTTLMEYVADRLGLIFMKINGPALGHEVRSLDPAQAPDATSARELEKLNLALEMGNNVMLYVDDIQHTHPEFLQKFISLCDGTRRIEGVRRGRTKTFDLRGKKFCVVMAGNPYTESGELFRIPDMLANRADVYNLGDVLGGMEDVFLTSYLENCLTSNPVLAPLATRDMGDFYRLLDKAEGRDFSAGDLSHDYSGAEIGEIVGVLQRLIEVRDVVYRVNQQYIASAAQADSYRTEPAFKLQGSYRNMNKLAEKIAPVTNAAELQQIIDDHYLGESQLLTSGAEENLLKLAELRDRMDGAQRERWQAICREFQRAKAIGGADADVGTRVVAQLHDLVDGVRGLAARTSNETTEGAPWPALVELLERIASEQTMARAFGRDSATDSAMWLGGLRSALEISFKPLIAALQAQGEASASRREVLAQLVDGLQRLAAQAPGAPAQPRSGHRTGQGAVAGTKPPVAPSPRSEKP